MYQQLRTQKKTENDININMELSTYSKNLGIELDMLNIKMQSKVKSIRNKQL